jgi:Protein of unknown function (DUF3808)
VGHRGFVSEIYGPGAELALCGAEAQIMQAVVGVLRESITESLKGFYKLRKAYQSLEAIAQAEARYKRLRPYGLSGQTLQLAKNPDTTSPEKPSTEPPDSDQDADVESFQDASEYADQTQATLRYSGTLEINGALHRQGSGSVSAPVSPQKLRGETATTVLNAEQPHDTHDLQSTDPLHSDIFSHPVDAFIHSGTCMCFGMLLLILSMIPPVFARLLYIIGFQGDRERGLSLLWQAAEYENINGATAGLVLLSYFNTFISFCDILPDADPTMSKHKVEGNNAAYPSERLEGLLGIMRQRYPKSCLWVIEAARMHAQKQNLSKGIELLSREGARSPLKQVVALAEFEKSLQALYAHEYSLCASSFQRCCELNSWSHALYLYIAGCAHVQLYRDAQLKSDSTKASKHAKVATDLFARAQSQSGKRKIFARQLPLEVYVTRKLTKWETRAKAQGLSLIDAIGVPPCEEMAYTFGGFKKMDAIQNERSMRNLQESGRLMTMRGWGPEYADEWAGLALLRAAALRARGQHKESMDSLQTEILAKDPSLFRGSGQDEWVVPVAHYEIASNLWAIRTLPKKSPQRDHNVDNVELARKAQEHLDKAAKWGSYDLEARMGMRITMGQSTVKTWLGQHDASSPPS